MLEEVQSYIPHEKKINVIDATFGGGGYSRAILDKFNVKQIVAIDRDPISKIFAKMVTNIQSYLLVNTRTPLNALLWQKNIYIATFSPYGKFKTLVGQSYVTYKHSG